MAGDRKEHYDLFQIALEGRSFFAEPGGLPNIRGFISRFQKELSDALGARWRILHRGAEMPLVVNVLISPAMFFCKHDALQAQYSRYFCPIYLDRKAAALDQGRQLRSADPVAEAIVTLHRDFERHYNEVVSVRSRPRSFLSLNDIESLLASDKPVPPSDTVISIYRHSGGYNRAPDHIVLADLKPFDRRSLTAQLEAREIQRPEVSFSSYLDRVTQHGGSYHHVTIGDDTRWLGRVYLAFRSQVEPDSAWLRRTKLFAFECVAAFALAGTFVRNASIVTMVEDVRDLLDRAETVKSEHRTTLEQFAGSRAIENRKQMPAVRDLQTAVTSFLRDKSTRLPRLQAHISTCDCGFCNEPRNRLGPISHAIKDCRKQGDPPYTAGAAVLEDVECILTRDCRGLPPEARSLVAQAIVFGLLRDSAKPPVLAARFAPLEIDAAWLRVCSNFYNASGIPSELLPFIVALLALCGNKSMVRSNAERLQVRLGSDRRIEKLKKLPNRRVLLKVTYRIKGQLTESRKREFSAMLSEDLNQNRARLMLYFGRQFVDDTFQMCITTKTGDTQVVAFSEGWTWPYPSLEGAITFAFALTV